MAELQAKADKLSSCLALQALGGIMHSMMLGHSRARVKGKTLASRELVALLFSHYAMAEEESRWTYVHATRRWQITGRGGHPPVPNCS